MLLTNFNLRKIASFLHDKRAAETKANTGEPPSPKSVRRRDRVWYNPYTKTTPRESVLELQLIEQLTSPLRT